MKKSQQNILKFFSKPCNDTDNDTNEEDQNKNSDNLNIEESGNIVIKTHVNQCAQNEFIVESIEENQQLIISHGWPATPGHLQPPLIHNSRNRDRMREEF